MVPRSGAAVGHEVRVGDAAESAPAMCASRVRTSGTRVILEAVLKKRFPQLWTPSAAMRDQRQLLRHRDKLVAKVKNSLQPLAMNRGIQKKSRLWTGQGMERFQQLAMPGWLRRDGKIRELLKQGTARSSHWKRQ